MGTNDAEHDLDRELARLKLRDIVIGSVLAAILLATIPDSTQRGIATNTNARARMPMPLLPMRKSGCAKDADGAARCSRRARPPRRAVIDYSACATRIFHRVDIRV